jgi:hypothetical protein
LGIYCYDRNPYAYSTKIIYVELCTTIPLPPLMFLKPVIPSDHHP